MTSNRKRLPEKRHLYLIQMDDRKLVKIGISTDPERRVKEIKSISGIPVKLIFFVELGHAAKMVERSLHDEFRRHRVFGEWFDLNDSQISGITDRDYLKYSPAFRARNLHESMDREAYILCSEALHRAVSGKRKSRDAAQYIDIPEMYYETPVELIAAAESILAQAPVHQKEFWRILTEDIREQASDSDRKWWLKRKAGPRQGFRRDSSYEDRA